MAKLTFCLCFVLIPIIQVNCLFAGDSCAVDGVSGVCTAIGQCNSLLKIIKDAGVPMPKYLREKLNRLTCGYELLEPMVCCPLNEGGADAYSVNLPVDKNPGEDRLNSPYNKHRDQDLYIWGSSDGYSNNRKPNKTTSETNDLEKPIDKIGDDFGNGDTLPDIRNHPNLKLLPHGCGNTDGNRILGGKRTLLREMPWMVLLSYTVGRQVKLDCAGTLIAQHYVLTAAHCVSFLGKSRKLNGVILGEHDLNQDPDCETNEAETFCAPNVINATIERVIVHEGYSRETQFDDIALIRLSEPVDFTSASTQAICLPSTPQLQRKSLIGENANIAGWGITEERIQSSVLLSVYVPVLNNDVCHKAYRRSLEITEKQICAGGEEGKDSCNGDSGGPLMLPGIYGKLGVKTVQRGIVSFGSRNCGIAEMPTVYTNIAYYMDWILNNMSD